MVRLIQAGGASQNTSAMNDNIAANRLLLSKRELAAVLNVSERTIENPSPKLQNPNRRDRDVGVWDLEFGICEAGVADGTRTRNNQNHNLGLYH